MLDSPDVFGRPPDEGVAHGEKAHQDPDKTIPDHGELGGGVGVLGDKHHEGQPHLHADVGIFHPPHADPGADPGSESHDEQDSHEIVHVGDQEHGKESHQSSDRGTDDAKPLLEDLRIDIVHGRDRAGDHAGMNAAPVGHAGKHVAGHGGNSRPGGEFRIGEIFPFSRGGRLGHFF